MDTKLLCRAYRKKTNSWLSLVIPEMDYKEQEAVWAIKTCGDQFMPQEMKSVPADMIDMFIETFAMETEPRKKNGPDTNDSWPEDGGPDFV